MDGKLVVLPQLEGLIILNILRYSVRNITYKTINNTCYLFLVGGQELNHGDEIAMKNNFLHQITGMVC